MGGVGVYVGGDVRLLAGVLTVVAWLMTASDITNAVALRQWRDGRVADGMRTMRLADSINPYNSMVRLDEIESLWKGYEKEHDPRYLHEAVLIAHSLVVDYPGNAQDWGVYSASLIFEATHGGSGMPEREALRAVAMDPISIAVIERAMFLLTAKRRDYDIFKTLGIARSRLTRDKLTMLCALCGLPWLEHR